MRHLMIALLLAVGLLAACGGDTNNPANNGTGKDAGTDVYADARTDAGQSDAGVDSGEHFSEREPNNTADTANGFSVGEDITGRIDRGAGDASDVDTFEIDLTGGTIFSFELTKLGAGFDTSEGKSAVVVFSDEDGKTSRVLLAKNGLKRSVFVPADGTYLLQVYDLRALSPRAVDNGGADSTYALTTSTSQPQPIDTSLPVDKTGTLTDSGVDVYAVTPDSDGLLLAETTAGRAPVNSDLDTMLFVWSVADGKTLAANDDFPGQDSTYDSRLAFDATSGRTYWVVVDAYKNANDPSYALSVTHTDDAASARTPIAAGGTATGEISERGADAFDTDYFKITMQPGETARLEVTADADLQPHMTVFVPTSQGNFTVAEAWPVGGKTAVEFAHPTGERMRAQDYLINIDDARNVPADDAAEPANVGGSSYGYTLSAADITWTPGDVTLPLTAADSLADVGNYAWYTFSAPANSVVGLSASTTASEFDPIVAMLPDSGIAVPATQLAYLVPGQTELTAGVRDRHFRGGSGYDFTPSFVAVSFDGVTFDNVAESEPNDGINTAQDLTSDLPAAIAGSLEGTAPDQLGPDYYKVTLTSGDVLGVYTEAGADANTPDADTVLTVLDASGAVVFFNDDYVGQDSSYFSAAAFVAPADGDYYVVVEPYCDGDPAGSPCGGDGDYTVALVKK